MASRAWTAAEDFYLKTCCKRYSIEKLTRDLDRSRTDVLQRLNTPAITKALTPTKTPKTGRYKGGVRSDIEGEANTRSGWEANCLRWMTYQKIPWEYEPQRFSFEKIKRGTRSYLPDMRIILDGEYRWIEVKGQLRATDKTRLRRFQLYYPEEFAKLMGIPGSKTDAAGRFFAEMGIPILATYRDLNRKYKGVIPEWE